MLCDVKSTIIADLPVPMSSRPWKVYFPHGTDKLGVLLVASRTTICCIRRTFAETTIELHSEIKLTGLGHLGHRPTLFALEWLPIWACKAIDPLGDQ